MLSPRYPSSSSTCDSVEDNRFSTSAFCHEPFHPITLDETRRTVDLGHSSDGPSWIDLAAIRVNTTESRFVASLNRLLQQNRPFADVDRLHQFRNQEIDVR